MTVSADPVVGSIRDEIAALDVRLLSTINARIRKVAELREYKQQNGIDFLDPDREAWLVAYLKRVNGGPL
ncbi:MAG TPA: chorismate mutase, partial [Gaiellaceae bacterium]|nr:chorismate mutase [Gaiellaceae bacterium]